MALLMYRRRPYHSVIKVASLKNNILAEIERSLARMEDAGRVDLAILGSLSKLRDLLKSIKSRWLDVEDSDGFYFYQAARNTELILDRMEHRFKNSQKANDNPQIAEDSLTLLPVIDEILEITQSYKVDERSINKVLDSTRDLRNRAADTNLIEPLEINRKYIDHDNMRSRFDALMENLGVSK